MAHQINFNEQTGKHSFFSVKEKAWHGLGQIVTDYPNSREALQFAGLDFKVIKRPIFTASIMARKLFPKLLFSPAVQITTPFWETG